MKLWIVKLDCGDYYCDGNHIGGIYSTQEAAERRKSVLNDGVISLDYPARVKEYVLDEDAIKDGVVSDAR